jgi:hypothetical protein
MPKLLKRWRARRERESKEALERLAEQSEHGPDALKRFADATRKILTTPKEEAVKRQR